MKFSIADYDNLLKLTPAQRNESIEKSAQNISIALGTTLEQLRQMRTDKESSTLEGYELQEAVRIYDVITDKYKHKLKEMGGVDAVLLDLEKYILEELGDSSYKSDPTKRAFNPKIDYKNPPMIEQLKGALRAILDHAPGTSFGNFLDPGAVSRNRYEISTGSHTRNAREMLAYFWLAASDPSMPLDEKDEPNRAIYIKAEKMMVIYRLYEIRRAHNDDVYSPMRAVADHPSCGPGTFGRISKMHLYNKLTEIKPPVIKSPVLEFKNQVPIYITDQFRRLSLAQQVEILNYWGFEEKGNSPFFTMEKFLNSLKYKNEAANGFIGHLERLFGKQQVIQDKVYKVLDRDHNNYAVLTYIEELEQLQNKVKCGFLYEMFEPIMFANLVNQAKKRGLEDVNERAEIKEVLKALDHIAQDMKDLKTQLAGMEFTIIKTPEEFDQVRQKRQKLGAKFLQLEQDKIELEEELEKVSRKALAEETAFLIQELLPIKTEDVGTLVEQLVGEPISETEIEKHTEPHKEITVSLEEIIQRPDYKNMLKTFLNTQPNKNAAIIEKEVQGRVAKNILTMRWNEVLESTIPDEDARFDAVADNVAKSMEKLKIDLSESNTLRTKSDSVQEQLNATNSASSSKPSDEAASLSEQLQIEYSKYQAGILDANDFERDKFSMTLRLDFDLAIERLNRLIQQGSTDTIKTQAQQIKDEIRNYYYHKAKALDKRMGKKASSSSMQNEEHQEYLRKIQLCGISADLALNPHKLKDKGVDQTSINPSWLVRILANFEHIEQDFKLAGAQASKELLESRGQMLAELFAHYLGESFEYNAQLYKMNTDLVKAIEDYFALVREENAKDIQIIRAMDNIRYVYGKMLTAYDERLDRFWQYLQDKKIPFYENDKLYLKEILANVTTINKFVHSSNKDLLTQMCDREVQIYYLEKDHTELMDSFQSTKRSCEDMIQDFLASLIKTSRAIQEKSRKSTSKDSLAHRQMHLLQQATAEVGNILQEIKTHESAGIVPLGQYINWNNEVVNISNTLENKLQTQAKTKEKKFTKIFQPDPYKYAFNQEQLKSVKSDSSKVQSLLARTKQSQQASSKLSEFTPMQLKQRKEAKQCSRVIAAEVRLATIYLSSHKNPEALGLKEYLQPGTIVYIDDYTVDPITVLFTNPFHDDVPKHLSIPAEKIKNYAEKQLEVYDKMPMPPGFSPLFDDFPDWSINQDGDPPPSSWRDPFLEKLTQVFMQDPHLIPKILRVQKNALDVIQEELRRRIDNNENLHPLHPLLKVANNDVNIILALKDCIADEKNRIEVEESKDLKALGFAPRKKDWSSTDRMGWRRQEVEARKIAYQELKVALKSLTKEYGLERKKKPS